jgi:2-amino-4-hydroxy-6-hydroxymethyldihydropteridine diphosphokinase
MTRAYIGLGSNLGDRAAMLRAAVLELARAVTVAHVSSVYETAPWGKRDQPSFLNACAAIDTTLAAPDLLALLLRIEAALGRRRGEPWGPRTIDLDLLLFGAEVISSPDLVVPHPRLTERAFVLVPLAEIAPEARIPPAGMTVRDALERLPRGPGDVRLVAGPIGTRPGTAR